jgi:hypothetical protein
LKARANAAVPGLISSGFDALRSLGGSEAGCIPVRIGTLSSQRVLRFDIRMFGKNLLRLMGKEERLRPIAPSGA